MNNILTFFLLGIFFIGCSGGDINKRVAFSDGKWVVSQPLVLQIQGKKELKKTYFQVDVIYDHSYKYKNLPFILKIEKPDASLETLKKDLRLFDDYGRPIGKGFFSDKRVSFVLNDTIDFGEEKDYYISLFQNLREDTLLGIKEVQLKVLPH